MTKSQDAVQLNPVHFVIDFARNTGLQDVAKSILNVMPDSIQEWANQQLAEHFWRNNNPQDFVIVPIESLKQKQKEALLLLIEKVGVENLGDYLEFGVYSGSSLYCMFEVLNELKLNHVRLFGFDSFQGMPNSAAIEDEGTWYPGEYECSIYRVKSLLTKKGIDWQRVFLTKGWYCDTLKPDLLEKHQIKQASVIMVDCDLYSSTKDVLAFCAPLIKGPTIIFFDDWDSNDLAKKNLGERKAFEEFLQTHPDYTVEPFGGYDSHSDGFIVTPIAPAESENAP